MNLKHLVFRSTLVAILLGCSRVSRMDYRTADPIADAKRAFSQDDYRVVGVKLGDSVLAPVDSSVGHVEVNVQLPNGPVRFLAFDPQPASPDRPSEAQDRKSTRLNSSHLVISYAVFCLKKKKKKTTDSSHACRCDP